MVVKMADKLYIRDEQTNPTFDSDAYEAARKQISDWGSEGYKSAAMLVGEDKASEILREHIKKNIRESNPRISEGELEILIKTIEEEQKKTFEKSAEGTRYEDSLDRRAENLRAAAREAISDWGDEGQYTASMYEDRARALEIASADNLYGSWNDGWD